MQTIVISLGGSVLLSERASPDFLRQLAALFKKISKSKRLFIVVGGGNTARVYINRGRSLELSEDVLDELGIAVTRVNATLLSHILKSPKTIIPSTTTEAARVKDNIVIMGGTTPGHSTDMVGAELAATVQADRYIIATNVDGIFDKDPNAYSDAQQIKNITIDQLIKTYGTSWETAGKNVVVDGPALKIIKESRIQTYVLNGMRLDQLEKALTDQSFDGTIITV